VGTSCPAGDVATNLARLRPEREHVRGDLDELHTRGAETDRWSSGFVRGPVRLAVVVRDLRGGTAWAVRDVVVRP
jgi:hypothetical protein